MPKKIVVEKDDNVDVVKSTEQKETFATRWFKDYATTNAEELRLVCDLTARSARDQFGLTIKTSHSEVYGCVFYATFKTILDFIRSKQKSYNNFTIVIAKSINIGYTNNDDEENEKVGNFMPIMEYVGINQNIVNLDNLEQEGNPTVSEIKKKANDMLSKRFISWKELNCKKNAEYVNEIQEKAFAALRDEYHIFLRTSEAIIPLFCVFLDNISNVLKVKFQEADGTEVSEVSMNVFGLFKVFYSFDEAANMEVIEFEPGIQMKLGLKSDENSYKE